MSSLYVLYDVPELELVRSRILPKPGLFRSLFEAVRDWNERRLAMRELYAMPTRMLRDIGVERDAIPYVVNGLHSKSGRIHA